MDCSSLSLHGPLDSLADRERSELVRRRLALLSYLLRSPLYDRRSKVRPGLLSAPDDVLVLQVLISWLLARVRDTVPGLGSLAGAALKYLPEYQQVYFYVWN